MRVALLFGLFVVAAVASCTSSRELLQPPPTASAESLFVVGVVRTVYGQPVGGAALQLSVLNTQRGSTTIGTCTGEQLGDVLAAVSEPDGSYAFRFRESNVRPPVCIAVAAVPPTGSALVPSVASQPDAFRSDRAADTLELLITLPQ